MSDQSQEISRLQSELARLQEEVKSLQDFRRRAFGKTGR